MSSSIIQAANLRKTYEVGGTLVHALDGLDVQIEKGAYIALMGAFGVWEVDFDECFGLFRYSHFRRLCAKWQ